VQPCGPAESEVSSNVTDATAMQPSVPELSTWGPVAVSRQKKRRRISERSRHKVDARQYKATMRPSPVPTVIRVVPAASR
jgi:hypothetical protein